MSRICHSTGPANAMLQRGRDPKTAECIVSRGYTFRSTKLQRGRDPKTAECDDPLPMVIHFISFNGAAILRPRNATAPAGGAAASGAGFNGAAILRPRNVHALSCRTARAKRFNGAAILRPRNARRQVSLQARIDELQRGRDP